MQAINIQAPMMDDCHQVNHAGEAVMTSSAPGVGEVKRLGFLQGPISVPDDFDWMGHGEIEHMFSINP